MVSVKKSELSYKIDVTKVNSCELTSACCFHCLVLTNFFPPHPTMDSKDCGEIKGGKEMFRMDTIFLFSKNHT